MILRARRYDGTDAGTGNESYRFLHSTAVASTSIKAREQARVGRDEAAIREYIKNQEKEDERLDQIGPWR